MAWQCKIVKWHLYYNERFFCDVLQTKSQSKQEQELKRILCTRMKDNLSDVHFLTYYNSNWSTNSNDNHFIIRQVVFLWNRSQSWTIIFVLCMCMHYNYLQSQKISNYIYIYIATWQVITADSIQPATKISSSK